MSGENGNELLTPLLRHGGDYGDVTAATSPPPRTRGHRTSDPGVIAAAAHVVAQDTARRRNFIKRNTAANLRHLHRVQSQGRRDSVRRASGFAAPGGEIVEHRNERLESHQSEATDYSYRDEGNDDDDDDDDENNDPKMMAKAASVVLVTSAGIASYLAAFVASITMPVSAAAAAVVGVAGGVCILMTPLVWISEWRLTRQAALRRHLKDLRHEANRFQSEVDLLMMEEQDLKEEVEIFQQDKERLDHIVKEKNLGNVDDLVALVHENKRVLCQMKENVRQMVLQDVVKLVLQSDLARDNKINKNEYDILETRLTISLQSFGIEFDARKFRQAVGLSPSLIGVIAIVRRLIPDENGRLSSLYTLESDDESEAGDVYDMFHVPMEEQSGKAKRRTRLSLATSLTTFEH